ncbi:MFS transporter [Streptomyces sp. TRM 70351]|uniref:MFS transporter n=1 Tax=Streptomyces sp. TRM 70351 TaxID=3116552 RepID=UPI002E7BE29E|nr:MFS transporter [Streptomyces sp. TRM 70351]MEE1926967.1 MFS transporter [Streptomyces sp. TRM 70351]
MGGERTGGGQPRAAGLRLSERRGKWVLFTTVLGSGMALLDGTVVNVALPHIGEDLGAGLAGLQWTVNAYLLTLAGLILLGGALGDRYGRRRVFTAGVVWFALASVLCGLAPDAGVLVAARALQGVGGALLTPGSLALLQSTFHPDDRARAVGAWSGLGGVAAAVGPFVGGWLVDGPGWRWVFLINAPLALVCLVAARRHVPETRDTAASGRFDVAGAALAAFALGGVTYALIAAPEQGLSAVVAGSAAGGVVLGAAFVRLERRLAAPMVPPAVFRSRQFTAVNAVTLCVYAAFGGFFFLSVVQLQVVVGYSALQAGVALLPTTLLMLLLSSRSGALGQRIGPRLPLTAGPLLCAGGMLLFTRAGPGASYPFDVLPGLAVLGTGMVLLVAPLTATVLASVDVSRAGLASGVNNAVARAAGLVAVAALPLLAGMGPDAYRNPAAFDASFGRAMTWCAAVLAVGAVVAWLSVRGDVLESGGEAEGGGAEKPGEADGAAAGGGGGAPEGPRPCGPRCRTHCAVSAPPLDPGDAAAPEQG